MRQTLLASVAALALAAASATGAVAQKQQGAPGASGMSAPAGTTAPSANPSGASGPSSGTSGAAQQEQSEQPAPNAPGAKKSVQDRTIPEKQKSTQQTPSKGDKEQRSTQQAPSKAEQPRLQQGQNATPGTKQGGASTSTSERSMTSKNVSLTTEQKTTIRSKVLTSSAPRVTNVNFDIKVGVVVPRTIRIAPVPTTLVEIEPEWRGFMYFVRGDEIIIVDPRSLEIVAVVEV